MLRRATVLGCVLVVAAAPAGADETVLFDFAEAAQAGDWANHALPGKGLAQPAATVAWEAGRLKITFAGGDYPHIGTVKLPADWSAFKTLRAEVTVPERRLVGLRVMQAKSQTGFGYRQSKSRFECTEYLAPGKNTICWSLDKPGRHRSTPIRADGGKVVSMQFYVYRPGKGEVVYLDNIRVSTVADPAATNAKNEQDYGPKPKFRVLGTDLTVSGVKELGEKLKGKWKQAEVRTFEQVEAAFKAAHAQLKGDHGGAATAVFRQGRKGYDPAAPDKAYAGWADVHVNSHGPDGNLTGRGGKRRDHGSFEVFMRHRSQLIRVDVSSIPKGSRIFAAQLVLLSAPKAIEKANMFVAEACNRPWVEAETTGYQYADGKLWKTVGGKNWWGDDSDFLSVYLAHGPATGGANTWDFTEAVKYWTDGKHANHGFMLHGDANAHLRAFTKDHKQIESRPALMVIYEPATKE